VVSNLTKRNWNSQDHRRFFGEKQCWICGKRCEGRRRHYCSEKCGAKMQRLVDSTTWSLVKEKALVRDGRKCVLCDDGLSKIEEEKARIEKRLDEIHPIVMKALREGKMMWDLPEDRERQKLESRLDYLDSHAMVVDHIIPMAMGGAPFDLDNLQTLCAPCNTKKTRFDLRSLKYFKRCRTYGQRKEFVYSYLKTLQSARLMTIKEDN
jgi:5-methylcytosine-specific restriction endonuclease McrA